MSIDLKVDRFNKEKIILTNIQRFSLHDGPGIRSTCFLKGCSLCCPWCCNPENISSQIQHYIKDGKEGSYGVFYSPEQLYKELIKDEPFFMGGLDDYNITSYEQIRFLPGGVTFSGGECLLQIEALIPVIELLEKKHIHIAVETCLFIPCSNLKLAIKYFDLFYVDIKILDEEKCEEVLNGKLSLYLSNLDMLLRSGKPVVFRVPVIGGYTDGESNRKKVAQLIGFYVKEQGANLLKVELIKEHQLGISKYKSLQAYNKEYKIPEYRGVSDELLKWYQQEIASEIGGIIPVDICSV
jgi:pyruvate formate lyase activating enzyme